MWTMTNVAQFTMRDKSVRCCNNPTVLVSLPVYNRLVGNNMGLNNTRFDKLMIKLNNPKSIDDIRAVKKAFKENLTAD